MDGESTAFLSQILEVEKAVENLAKSGKLYFPKSSTYSPQQQHSSSSSQQYSSQSSLGQSRYPSNSHYGSHRNSGLHSGREYGAQRGMGSMHQSSQVDFGASYYPPPPPLQQQYFHSQQQNAYPGPPSSMSLNSYEDRSASAMGSQAVSGRYEAQQSYQAQAGRPFSPLGGPGAGYAPLTRLSTGSSHSTTHSISAGMSSSTSMLPPGYGRDGYGSALPSTVHSRAHSIAGSVGGLAGQQPGGVHHGRNQSITQLSESGRTLSNTKLSSGTASTTGVFSPPIQEHSRTASISGSTSTPSPSAAAFNFFTGPSTQIHGSSAMQSSMTSNTGNAPAFSRIAPIGRPSHLKSTSSDTIGSSRMPHKPTNGTGQNSGVTSGVASPLSSGFSDGWLDSTSPSRMGGSNTNIENQKRGGVQSVWNN